HAAPANRRAAWPHGHARTDAEGRFAIEGAQAGDVTVYAEGAGWATKGASEEALRGETPLRRTLVAGETSTVDLRVVPADVVRGRVLDSDGAPAAGAIVRADTDAFDPRGWVSFAEDPATRSVAATDGDGRFALAGVAAEKGLTLRVLAVGSLEQDFDRDTSSGTTSADVEIRLLPVREIEVTVLDGATGRPVAGADVEVRTSREDSHRRPRAWKGQAGADGRVRAGPLLEGQPLVEARADG